MSAGYSLFKLAFQISPIMLVNGIATNIPGGMLPIVSVTESANFSIGLLGDGSSSLTLDNFFAHYEPMPGSTLIENQLGTYPFANQSVAGNAIITQPLSLSLKMTCPAKGFLGMGTKLVTMIALKRVLDEHIALGGTFTVVTPSYFYTNGVLLRLVDISPGITGENKQAQTLWQWDFSFPLLTLEQADTIQNSLMSKLSSGTQIQGDPSWSGVPMTVNAPNSLASPLMIPAATNLPAASTAPFNGVNIGIA